MRLFRVLFSITAAVCTVACSSGPAGADSFSIVYLDLSPCGSPAPDDSLALLEEWDRMHAAATLQGIVNRNQPRLYIDYIRNGSIDIDRHWWDLYRKAGEWLHGRDTICIHTLDEAIEAFRTELNGLVVYDSHIASTSNVASSVSGMEDLIAIRYDPRPGSLYTRMIQAGLEFRERLVNEDGTSMFKGEGIIPGTDRESSGSLKCDPYIWFIERYFKTGLYDGRYAGYYLDQFWRSHAGAAPINHHCLTNHDFFVARKGFFFDLSPWADEASDDPGQKDGTDYETLGELLRESYEARGGKSMLYIGGFPAWAYKYTRFIGGKHGEVETEWHFAELISSYLAFKDADAISYGAMANASFWQHFPLRKHYRQERCSIDDLESKGYIDRKGRVDKNRNYVVIYTGDYDASSWLTQMTPYLWDDPARGSVPLMWSISPVLCERAPMVMDYIRRSAGPNDSFAASDNGAGYLMPGVVEAECSQADMECWETHCKKYYRRWDLDITGFVIDGTGPQMGTRALDAYSRFSKGGLVAQRCPAFSIHNGMPVMRSDADLVSADPAEAARLMVERIHDRNCSFHWFRTILKSPEWHKIMLEEAKRLDPTIEPVKGDEFFKLLKEDLSDTL